MRNTVCTDFRDIVPSHSFRNRFQFRELKMCNCTGAMRAPLRPPYPVSSSPIQASNRQCTRVFPALHDLKMGVEQEFRTQCLRYTPTNENTRVVVAFLDKTPTFLGPSHIFGTWRIVEAGLKFYTCFNIIEMSSSSETIDTFIGVSDEVKTIGAISRAGKLREDSRNSAKWKEFDWTSIL